MALSFEAAELALEEATAKLPRIACPECGVSTVARDDGFLCLDCVRTAYDWRAPLERHVQKHPTCLTVRRCGGCDRVDASAPGSKKKTWESAARDTDELLAFLLRRVRTQLLGKKALDLVDGLSAGLRAGDPLKLEDARLVWTEPHSRRLLVEADVVHASVRQRLRLEFVEEKASCDACNGEARERRGRKMGGGGGDFAARVQVRVASGEAARTMRSLEDAVRAIGKKKGGPAFMARRLPRGKGLDVDLEKWQDGDRFVDELRKAGRAPLRVARRASKLITHDPKSNTVERQKVILLEIPPISKHDLVVAAPRGGKPALHLVTAVRREIRLKRVGGPSEVEVNAEQFFRRPFGAVASASALVDVRVVAAPGPLDEAAASTRPPRGVDASIPHDGVVLVSRADDDDAVAADASRLPEASRRPGAVIKAFDLDTLNLETVPTRFVLVAPGGVDDVGDATTTVSTVLSRKERRKLKKRGAPSVADTVRDFDDDELQLLIDQPGAIAEEDDEAATDDDAVPGDDVAPDGMASTDATAADALPPADVPAAAASPVLDRVDDLDRPALLARVPRAAPPPPPAAAAAAGADIQVVLQDALPGQIAGDTVAVATPRASAFHRRRSQSPTERRGHA